MLTVLIVDDEGAIRDVVRAALGADFSRYLEAPTAADALAIAATEPLDAVVLDLGLPDLDGLDVCRKLRRGSSVPIVVLSARHDEAEKVALLDAGADDYVTKPFGPPELRARVRAQVRRARTAPQEGARTNVAVGGLVFDMERHTVSRGGTAIHLTPTEWALVSALVANAGRTMTHQQLFTAVWGKAFGHPQQYLRVYITHVRKKIERDPYVPRLIITEPGVGYRFEVAEPGE